MIGFVGMRRELLKQAKGYDNQLVVETNIRNLESSLAGDNVKEIRARAQGLTTANRDLQQFLTEQKAEAEALLNARQAANEELTRTPILLTQAQGYGKQNQVASAQKPLELALAGENADEIKSKTQALVAVNRDLDQYIQDAKAAAEKKRQQENQARVFVATKQRAEKAIGSATAAVTGAAKYSGDKEIATASRSTAQTMNELSAKARTADPRDEPQISKLTERLGAEQSRLSAMTRQTVVLNSSLGRRVYEGCSGWAKRKGMITSAPVRFFKDDATNQAADLATNMGTHLCRCMTVEIAGDTEITDQAKLEIARQFETRDRMDNQALAVVVGGSFIKCQAQITDELSGGRLSGR